MTVEKLRERLATLPANMEVWVDGGEGPLRPLTDTALEHLRKGYSLTGSAGWRDDHGPEVMVISA